jgi:hypothetical protein
MTAFLVAFATLSALGTLNFAFLITSSFLNPSPSGDTAGAALGSYFLSSFAIPFAGLFAIAAVADRESSGEARRAGKGIVIASVILQGAGVLVALFGVAGFLARPAAAFLRFAGMPVFGLLLWVCGARLRAVASRPSRIFLGTGSLFVLSLGAFFLGTLSYLNSQRSEPNAPPIVWTSVATFHAPLFVMMAIMVGILVAYATRGTSRP